MINVLIEKANVQIEKMSKMAMAEVEMTFLYIILIDLLGLPQCWSGILAT